MLTWHYVTSEAYNAAPAENKTDDKLFFLSDTKEIYRGTQSFTESVILYSGEEPTTKALGKLYVNETTLEGRIWTGSDWKPVIHPVQSVLSGEDTIKPVSGKAVADYVAAEIAKVTPSIESVKSISYNSGSNSFTVTMTDDSEDTITMENVAADLHYDKASGLLQVKNASGTTIGTGINLDLERFVSEASYDPETHQITLKFNDDSEPLAIDVGDLVDTYTAGDTSTIDMTISGNQFTAEVIVASAEGYSDNILKKTDNGLYVAPIDLSGKMDKDTDAVSGNIATFDGTGNAVDSGKSIGGSTLAGNSDLVLATEAAVAAIRDTLQAAIDAKMTKVGAGHDAEIIVASADGDASASGIKVGGESMKPVTDVNTVATEKAVETYVTNYAMAKENIVAQGSMSTSVDVASDTKVPSEKAVVEAMTWKTTI